MKNLKKIISIIAVVGLFIAFAIFGYIYYNAFTANTKFAEEEVYVYIPSNSNYEQASAILKPYIKDFNKFEFVANARKYNSNVKSGRFLLKKDMSNFDIIRALRQNLPVQVAFNNQESIEKLVQRLSNQLEPDSLSLLIAFTNEPFLKQNNISQETALTLFIPNTYEFFWNTSADKIAQKMAKEHQKFWSKERLQKAQEQNLTQEQVYTLASIIHKESVKADERPKIAGVYLNRLKINMPLQADPTIIYAIKKEYNDFDRVIKRVLHSDLQINSPYNTYKNTGLPPGPIAMPDVSAIDAVLNPEKHQYIYFCASPNRAGYHDFATSYAEHQKNAKKYADWVNKLGINR